MSPHWYWLALVCMILAGIFAGIAFNPPAGFAAYFALACVLFCAEGITETIRRGK